jgi:hypothetical protein
MQEAKTRKRFLYGLGIFPELGPERGKLISWLFGGFCASTSLVKGLGVTKSLDRGHISISTEESGALVSFLIALGTSCTGTVFSQYPIANSTVVAEEVMMRAKGRDMELKT